MTSKERYADTDAKTNLDKQNNLAALEKSGDDLADAPPVGELTESETGGKTNEHTYELEEAGVNYIVKIAPFEFNGDTRYYINVNEGPSHLFLWDANGKQLKPLDDKAPILPDTLIKVISEKLLPSK